MSKRERQAWFVVGAIFVAMFFIWGGINSGAVFFVPVLKTFGWTREKLSVALSIGWITGGAAGPAIGWIADRVNPKKMMIFGAAITGLLWLALSRATTFGEFLAINGAFGICVGASTTIPMSLIIAGWFEQRRGLAMGIAFAGATIGGAVMTMVASFAVQSGGWRIGYVVLALPILLAVVPAIMIVVHTSKSAAERDAARVEKAALGRPTAPPSGTASPSIVLPGLEISQAWRTRSFLLLCVIELFAGTSIGMAPHVIAYLTGIGYTATIAASVISLYLIGTTAGTLFGGPAADRFGARVAMVGTFVLSTIGMIGMAGAGHLFWLIVFIVAGGYAAGAFAVQIPLVMIESLGMRRLGSVMGICGVFYTLGAAFSPIAAGKIFDVTHSYMIAILTFMTVLALSAVAMLGVRSLESEQAQFAPRPEPAAIAVTS